MKTQLRNALTGAMLLLIPTLNFAQAPPLATAADFVLFTSVGAVTNVGTYKYLTHLTGNVGTNSGSSTNFGNVNGVMHDGDGASLQCATDLLIAYNSLSAAIPTATLLNPVIGNGDTLTAGIYLMPGAASLNLGLTLDAQGDPNAVFIFKTPTAVAYAFTANPNSKIYLINGAKACNVFWQISGAVNMGVGVTMRGTIVSGGAISMGAQDTLEGRALTINGAITVSNGALGFLAYTPIGCGSPVLNGPPAPTFVGLASYVVFATTGSNSDCGTSHVTGDVGGNTVAPTGWNPLFVSGGIYFNNPSTAAAAGDLLLIYNNLLGLAYDIKLLDPAEFGHSLVLTPHTYQMDAAVTFTDTIFLDALGNADAVFIIKTFGAFASTPGSQVKLINGTQAKNVYWFVTGAVSITANSNFKGAIIAHDAIDILTGASLDGRAFSTTGAISTCGMTANIPPTSIIVTQPGNQTACVGSSVSFSVTASGTGHTYQWRKGTSNLNNGGNISGATSDTLRINPVNISDAATNYNVVVTGPPNDTSINVSLIVNPLPAAAAGADRALCSGVTTTLGADPVVGSTYSWTSVPVGFTSTLANPTVTPLVTTTYTVVETITATGCNNTHSVVVTVTPTVGTPTAITISAGTEPTCQLTNGTTTTTYATTATNSTGFNWSLSNGSAGSIGATTGLMTWANGFSGTVNIQVTSSGCNGPSLQVIRTVTITPTVGTPTVITISAGTEPTCQLTNGTTTTTYATTATNSTGFNWSLSNGSAGSIGATTGLMTWANGFSGTVNIQVTASGCNGPSLQVIRTVTITPTVGTPTAITISAGTEPACQLINGTTTTTYATTATNTTGFNWSLSSGSAGSIGAATGIMTWANGFSGTVNIQVTVSGCNGPSSQVIRTVTVIPTVGTPIFLMGTTSTRCQGAGTVTYTATSTNNTGISYTLDAASLAGGNTIVGATGIVTYAATWSGTTTITASAAGCNGPATTTHVVTVNPLPAAVAGANRAICLNTSTTLGAAAVTGSTYSWTSVPVGFTSTLANPTVTPLVTTTYTVVETITATGCNNTHSVVVTVNPLPLPIITGQSTMCVNSGYYNYTTEPGMNSYSWIVSPGGSISGGTGTNQITVSWIASGPQTVSVNYTNLNGCTAATPTVLNVTVYPLPSPAGTITGTANVCAGTNGVTYTVASIPNAIGYAWTVPAGASIVGPSNTNSITVDFSPAAVSGNITVLGTNSCGNGTVSPNFAVTVNPIPAAPVVTNTGYTAYSSAPTGNQWYYSATSSGTGAPISGATAQTYDATQTGTGWYWSIVTLNGCSSDASNHKLIIVVGIDSHSSSSINVYPVPNDGRFTVSIISSSQEPFTITVFSNLGVKIYEVKDIHVNGQFDQVIDLRPVFNGIYTVIIRNSIYHIVKKVVVSR